MCTLNEITQKYEEVFTLIDSRVWPGPTSSSSRNKRNEPSVKALFKQWRRKNETKRNDILLVSYSEKRRIFFALRARLALVSFACETQKKLRLFCRLRLTLHLDISSLGPIEKAADKWLKRNRYRALAFPTSCLEEKEIRYILIQLNCDATVSLTSGSCWTYQLPLNADKNIQAYDWGPGRTRASFVCLSEKSVNK